MHRIWMLQGLYIIQNRIHRSHAFVYITVKFSCSKKQEIKRKKEEKIMNKPAQTTKNQ